jgi:signal transduction histidine kinase
LKFSLPKLNKNQHKPNWIPLAEEYPTNARRPVVALVIGILSLVAFGVDCITVLDYRDWLWYLVPLILSARAGNRLFPYWLCAILTGLIIAGFYTSPPGIDPHTAMVGRLLGICVMWGCAVLISGRIHFENQLRLSLAEQKVLQREVLEISDKERRNIGYELHDGLGQHLLGVAFKAKALEKDLASVSPIHAGELDKIIKLINEGIADTRSMARLLAPVYVAENAMPEALKLLAAITQELYQIQVDFISHLDELRFDEHTGMACYRIAQEAIRNAIYHGEASRIEIFLQQEKDEACLIVLDNGKGFSAAAPNQSGMGIRIMEYRATEVGGGFSIHSEIGKGTEVTCRVPITAK